MASAPLSPAPREGGEAPHALDRVTFGKRLRSTRKSFGWTLQQVADASGISVTTISRAERGQLALSYERFSALARALQMDLAAMFAEVGSRTRRLDGPVVTRAGKGVAYREIDVSADPSLRSAMVQRANGRRTVPQIFIGKTHVGGSDDLHALEHAGKLDPMLAE